MERLQVRLQIWLQVFTCNVQYFKHMQVLVTPRNISFVQIMYVWAPSWPFCRCMFCFQKCSFYIYTVVGLIDWYDHFDTYTVKYNIELYYIKYSVLLMFPPLITKIDNLKKNISFSGNLGEEVNLIFILSLTGPICPSLFLNPFPPRPAKTAPFIILLSSNVASGWERVNLRNSHRLSASSRCPEDVKIARLALYTEWRWCWD